MAALSTAGIRFGILVGVWGAWRVVWCNNLYHFGGYNLFPPFSQQPVGTDSDLNVDLSDVSRRCDNLRVY